MDARQKAIVEAVRRVTQLLEDEFNPAIVTDVATVNALAAAIEGGQEMWQLRNDPEVVHTIADADEPHDWIKSDYRRVLVIELPEEK